MLKSVEGIYRNGKVELLEQPPAGSEDARVVVMFLPARNSIDLRERGIDPHESADLRARLAAFAEDWDRPEMDAYDPTSPKAE